MNKIINELKEIVLALTQIIMGIVVLIGGLIVLDLLVYLGFMSSTFNEQAAVAYEDGYNQAYEHNFKLGYQETYDGAYAKGYDKGYEIGLKSIIFREGVSSRVELHNPTYDELMAFLTADESDAKPYIEDEYNCFDFTAALNNNAEAKGIRAAYVRISFKKSGHAIVAFETVDRGLIFIEPQTDERVELVKGKPYPWQSSGAQRTTEYDDSILDIQLLW